MRKEDFEKYHRILEHVDTLKPMGRITQVIGLVAESNGPKAKVGELCYINLDNRVSVRAEVVGFKENKILLMPFGEMGGIGPGCEVMATGVPLSVRVSEALLGRVIDGAGNPMDEKGEIPSRESYPIAGRPPDPLTRRRITEPLSLGIKAIDGLLTVGKGQRMGIFSGSGVGKSTLLGMIARYTSADVNVIALIGERGREVREFLERDLGKAGLARSAVVVATSDQPPLLRLRGAFVAIAIAEYFRDQGKDVILMMDSVTRFARAQREVGLAIGEPPATRGFTPSVFEVLPKLLERSGTSDVGSITGLYTVLVESDDMNEPVADTVRAVLDGHIVLSRDLANANHYPAIDVLESVSRVMVDIATEEHLEAAGRFRDVLATYRGAEDLINIGAYVEGTNPKIDYAKKMMGRADGFLRQGIKEKFDFQETLGMLTEMFGGS
jgi:flagellum-specific ATP synthase